ncbi:MAG TPA: hypothetical protein VFS58_14115 [Steroidobacteraceae bacterium]|nr:hypothetical protein [Steroidobacteraceae bacterium]
MNSFNPGRFDERAEHLELKLQALLAREPFASDDRALARVYLAIARAFRTLLPQAMRNELDAALATQKMSTESGTPGLPAEGSSALDDKALEFLAKIVRSAARPKFRIDAESDTTPIGFGIALGISVDEMERILTAEYPPLSTG